jgi:hypothetical protein
VDQIQHPGDKDSGANTIAAKDDQAKETPEQ